MIDNSNITLNDDNIEIITKVKGFMPFVKIVCDSEEHANQTKQQILDNQEIVQRLKKSIKSIEDLADKDTMYEANSRRLKLVLPYLKSILEKQA